MQSRPATEALAARAVSTLAAIALGLCAVSGAVLAAVYRPHHLGALRVAHTGSAAVGLISALAAVVVARTGRIGVSKRGALLALVAILVIGGALTTGSSLAWTSGNPAARGVLLSGSDRVVVAGTTVSGDRVALGFVVHVVLALGAIALVVWAVGRQRRRAGNPDQIVEGG